MKYVYVKRLDGTIVENIIFNKENNSFIPFDSGNVHYQQYLEWLAQGNAPEEPDGL